MPDIGSGMESYRKFIGISKISAYGELCRYRHNIPALVVELKWNKNVKTALQQIKERKYPESIKQYTGDILLVGINYDKKTKEHQCLIERYEKK